MEPEAQPRAEAPGASACTLTTMRPSQHPSSLETLETLLENARQTHTPVRLVLGGRYEEPVLARVTARNGPTFEFAIGAPGEVTAVLRMEHSAVVLRTD